MRVVFAILVLGMIAACGDKVPQSQASKKLGDVPAQTRDRAVENTTKALKQSADRNAEAETK